MMGELKPYSKDDMRARVAAVMKDARHVRIDPKRLEQVARIAPRSIETQWYTAFRRSEEHYLEPLPVDLSDLDQLQFSLVSASQGWLIWQRDASGTVIPLTIHVDGERYDGAWGLMACHARALRRGQNILDPDVLINLTLRDVEDHYRDDMTGVVPVQLVEERLENFREIGRVLRDEFDGHFINVLRRAGGYLYRDDGNGLVQLLITKFPRSFGDWPMAKLPNVLVLGLLGRKRSQRFAPEIDRLLDFKDIENVEGGADYYRPMFFVRVGVFDISDDLKQKLRHHALIDAGSHMEQEFRAFTLQALRELAVRTEGWPQALSGLEVETHAQAFLRCRRCRVGISDEELPCSYRPVCKATHDDPDLMDCDWPLVITTEY